MNYRHAFHAGNFADVVKHVVLTRILLYLQDKPAAFRVIDTHAGAGLYDLTGEEASRGGEWQGGIGKLLGAEPAGEAAALHKPYLDIVRAFNDTAELTAYPGSPLIARALLRPQDRLVCCELDQPSRRQLIDRLRRDKQARVVDLDGWTALPAFVPPNERRGLVLVDPPFEAPDEFARMADTFAAAFAKWPTGIYMLWYPLKDREAARRWRRAIAETVATAMPGVPQAVLREHGLGAEFSVGSDQERGRGLDTAGLLIVNPPWTLERELNAVLPLLADVLGRPAGGRFSLDHPLS